MIKIEAGVIACVLLLVWQRIVRQFATSISSHHTKIFFWQHKWCATSKNWWFIRSPSDDTIGVGHCCKKPRTTWARYSAECGCGAENTFYCCSNQISFWIFSPSVFREKRLFMTWLWDLMRHFLVATYYQYLKSSCKKWDESEGPKHLFSFRKTCKHMAFICCILDCDSFLLSWRRAPLVVLFCSRGLVRSAWRRTKEFPVHIFHSTAWNVLI